MSPWYKPQIAPGVRYPSNTAALRIIYRAAYTKPEYGQLHEGDRIANEILYYADLIARRYARMFFGGING